MSTEAMANITPISQETNINANDEIANLLIGEDEADDSTEDENPTDESTNEDDSDNETEEETEESVDDLEAIADDEVTWEKTLGVKEEGLSFDDDGNLSGFHVKVNGETSTVSAEELVTSYQTNKAITNKSKALAEERKTFSGEKETLETTYKTKLETVDLLASHLEKQLVGDFNSVNWEELRISDPAEYAAMRQDFSSKAQELQQVKSAISHDSGKQSEEDIAKNNGIRDKYISEQTEQIVANNPSWADDKVRAAQMGEFKTFVTDKYGFTPDEFDNTLDSRLVELMKDAKKFHDGGKVAAKKVLRKVPGFQKSAGSSKKKTSKLDRLTAASKKATGSNKRDLQSSAIAELLT